MTNRLPVLVVFLGLCLMSLPVRAMDGQEGHGGDIAVSFFQGIAQRTLICLQGNPESWMHSYPLLATELESAIARTEVVSVERTILNGQEVDAINYPSMQKPRILLNRARWLDSRLDSVMRSHLIFHEYLSIIGYDDSRYLISYPIIQRNKKCIALEE